MRLNGSFDCTMMIDAPTHDCELKMQVAHVTGIGGRPSNEDAFGKSVVENLACLVVADGAGGHFGGDIAAQTAVNGLLKAFKDDAAFGHHALRSYVVSAADAVMARKAGEPELHEMSTTIAALLIDLGNASATWAHLGDTRIYHFRQKRLQHVTRDHSVIQRFVDAGLCEPDAVLTHPQRNVLYAAIGNEGDTDFVVHPRLETITVNDCFLICTDGLWAYLPQEELEASLEVAADVQAWLNDLCRRADASAVRSKRRDNFTAQAIWFTKSDSKPDTAKQGLLNGKSPATENGSKHDA